MKRSRFTEEQIIKILRQAEAGVRVEAHGYSERRACSALCVNRRTVRRPPAEDRDADLRLCLRELAEERRRFGAPRLHIMLRREGLVQNHKRTDRLYREENLSLRLRSRKKHPSHLRVVQPGPSGPDEQWSLDFMSDVLMNGRRIRVLTIVDLWDRSSAAVEVDVSLPGPRVVRVLDKLRLQGRLPRRLRTDNGSVFTGKALDAWAQEHDVQLEFIRPGKPTDNGHIESFNGKPRHECLNQNAFYPWLTPGIPLNAGGSIQPAAPTRCFKPDDARRIPRKESTL